MEDIIICELGYVLSDVYGFSIIEAPTSYEECMRRLEKYNKEEEEYQKEWEYHDADEFLEPKKHIEIAYAVDGFVYIMPTEEEAKKLMYEEIEILMEKNATFKLLNFFK